MSRVEMIARNATGSTGNPLKDMKLELTVNQKDPRNGATKSTTVGASIES